MRTGHANRAGRGVGVATDPWLRTRRRPASLPSATAPQSTVLKHSDQARIKPPEQAQGSSTGSSTKPDLPIALVLVTRVTPEYSRCSWDLCDNCPIRGSGGARGGGAGASYRLSDV